MLAGLRAWLLLDDIEADSRRWKISVYKIIISSSLLLCLLIAMHSFAEAWSSGEIAVIVTVTAYYVVLIAALRIGQKSPNLGAGILLLMIYVCGALLLLGLSDEALSSLGVIFLYVAPLITWIFFGPIKAFMAMVGNAIPFLYVVWSDRPLTPFGIDMLMPHTDLYLHALLFLFFNISIPLALFRVVSALNTSVRRNQQINQNLQRSNMLYLDIFEHASGPTLICDSGGRILKANNKACVLLGIRTIDAETPAQLSAFFESSTLSIQLDAAMQLAIKTGFSDGEFLINAETGQEKEVFLTIKSLSHGCLLVSIRDVSTLRAMERDLVATAAARDRLISYDHLTNLPNRDSLQEKLQSLMGDATFQRRNGLLAVACLRLNNVRSVNEKFGHQRGDDLIRDYAALLSLQQHNSLKLFRLRGVVFLILVTGCTTPEQIKKILEKLMADLPSQYQIEDQSIDFDISVGAAFTRGREISANDLIHRGERALEIARKNTKGPLVLFNEDSAREIHREIDISLALSRAISRNELSLVYQPKVDAGKSIKGLEALLRWYSPELGMVSPSEFIPLAEHIGKIHLISEFVIEQVCRQLAAWHKRFGKVWPVAINLSGIDLQRDNLVTGIQEMLRRYKVEPAWLQLEITETGLIENDMIARQNLERLMAIGLEIAIDDFGTGYSSLKKLSEFPIRTIKIDRSFVIAIGKNQRSERIIQLILTLAKVLDCEVVAEGVDTRRQLQFLQENGCARFQGYLFYKPLTQVEIDRLIINDLQALSR